MALVLLNDDMKAVTTVTPVGPWPGGALEESE